MAAEEKKQLKGKTILVVEDDYYFRIALEKSLQQLQHIPVCAENVAHAKQLIGLEPIDMVITDIRMPDESGLDVLKWIKANKPMPVVLMTGFSNIAETHDAAQLGADGFLAKPFKREDLVSTIETCFPDKAAAADAEPVALDDQFCKISIDDFLSGREIQSDIYVRVTELKYVKLAHKGEDIPGDRISAYKAKGIKYLYMQKEDFKKYLDFNLVLVSAVRGAKKLDVKKKMNLIKHTSEVMLQSLHKEDIDEEMFQQAGGLVENAVSILTDSNETMSLLEMLSTHSDHLYAHSVAVSMYAALIGKALGWNSPTTIFKLGLSGLLHDIGKKEIAKEILNKSRKDLTPADIAQIETHPTRGAEILSSIQGMSTDILQIVHEHHENCLGSGYPAHLRRMKIHPLARVVAVANEFANFAVKNPNSPGMKPGDAIQRMISLNPDYYDETALQALVKVFKLNIIVPTKRKTGDN